LVQSGENFKYLDNSDIAYFEAEDMGDEIILRSVVRADFEDEEDDY